MMIDSEENIAKLQAFLDSNASSMQPKLDTDFLALLKRERIEKPIIFLGTSTCGLVAGAGKTLLAIKNYIADNGIDAEVVEVGCIGLCSAEPVMDVQLPGKARISFQQVTSDKVDSILDGILNNELTADDIMYQYHHEKAEPWPKVLFISQVPFFANQTRIVLKNCGIINPADLGEYIAGGGYKAFIKTIRNYTSERVCAIVQDSGLRGRGGGGYPTGTKWKTTLMTPDDEKYMICNADESDPGAFMDRAVIEGDPHRVIEGIAIAAYAIGANKAYIYIRAEYDLAFNRMREALKQAYDFGLLGANIFESGVSISISLRQGAGAFVCGEETALIASIEGKRGMPRNKPPYPSEHGLFEKPTVVNNVETLANIPAIMENGPQWFSSIGTSTSKGTKVFALSGKIRNTGLAEVKMGTSLRDLVYTIGGGIKKDKHFKALQIGGPSGSCMPEDLIDTRVDYEELRENGLIMGSGGLVVMDEDTCMIDIAKFFTDFLQSESCGKCIPCREGTRRILEILKHITKKPGDDKSHETLERFKGVMQLENLAGIIRDTSLCGLGKTAPNPVLSTLKWFRDEYEEHIFDRKCRAGVCRELRTFSIDVEKCTGCTSCFKKCPENAIVGAPRQPHFIIAEKCTGCGICFDTCKFVAITVS